MTKQEYTNWIHSAKHITTDCNEYDSNGNHYARDIFEKDGKFYSVEYINGDLLDNIKIDENGKVIRRGVYELKEVKEETIQITRYKNVDEIF